MNDTFVKKNADNLDDNDKLAWKKALGILKNDGSNQLMNSWKIKAGTGSEETVTDGETVKFFAGEGLKITNTGKEFTCTFDKDTIGNVLNRVIVGKDGANGIDGLFGVKGNDGSGVVLNGKDGSIGLNGTNGQNGLSVRGEKGNEGKPGVDGTTIVKRIVVTDSDGQNPHSAATLDDA